MGDVSIKYLLIKYSINFGKTQFVIWTSLYDFSMNSELLNLWLVLRSIVQIRPTSSHIDSRYLYVHLLSIKMCSYACQHAQHDKSLRVTVLDHWFICSSILYFIQWPLDSPRRPTNKHGAQSLHRCPPVLVFRGLSLLNMEVPFSYHALQSLMDLSLII